MRQTIDLLTDELRGRGARARGGRGDRPARAPAPRGGRPGRRPRPCAADDAEARGEGGRSVALPARAGGRDPHAVPRRGVRRLVPPVGPAPDPRVAGRARRDRPRRPAGRCVPGVARELRRSPVGDPGTLRRADGRRRSNRRDSRGMATTSWMRRRPRSAWCLVRSPPIPEIGSEGLDAFIDAIAREPVLVDLEDRGPDLLARTAVEVRRWAEDRYGPLDAIPPDEYQTFWRAYDLPG